MNLQKLKLIFKFLGQLFNWKGFRNANMGDPHSFPPAAGELLEELDVQRDFKKVE